MNKKIIIFLSTLFVFGLVAVYAFNVNSTKTVAKSDSCCAMKDCCKDGVCKMGGSCCSKNKTESASHSHDGEKHSCGMADCCKDGKCKMGGSCCGNADSCPMKDKKDTTTESVDMTNVTVVNGESCCKPGTDCCKGGACCKKDKS